MTSGAGSISKVGDTNSGAQRRKIFFTVMMMMMMIVDL